MDMPYSMKWFLAADRRAQFEKLEFTDEDYQKELEHIEQVKPLIKQFFITLINFISNLQFSIQNFLPNKLPFHFVSS